ncbi:MAG: NAD(P)/FAD-dependent oxidoreductase [Salinivenus sp.]
MSSPLRLVLLGGGHAMLPTLVHADTWTQDGIDVTLIDPHRHLYYSGMVPEYLGGVYDEKDVRIDLRARARETGVSFVQDAAAAIDPAARRVETQGGDAFPFDVLAINVGSANPAVPNGAIATKPIADIRPLASQIEQTLAEPDARLRLVVVGGGAAGTEVALNVTGRFAGADRRGDLDLTIIEQADRLLPGFPSGLRTEVTDRLRRRGATVCPRTTVTRVEPNDDASAVVQTDTTSPLTADAVLWATGTTGPPLFCDGPLPTDDHGFVRTTRSLQVQGHPRLFAAGDCATIADLDLARVGVHAVKQGPTLRANLHHTLRSLEAGAGVPSPNDLQTFRPYPLTPLILSTGTADGLWTAGSMWARHAWLLRLKHGIDRRWIRQYAPERWSSASWREQFGAESAVSEHT